MTSATHNTGKWEALALVSGAFIVLAIAAYHFTGAHQPRDVSATVSQPEFVGTGACKDCHLPEFESWQGSHHDLAMDVASEDSVRGDFNDAEFTRHGVTSRFYRRDGRYYVHTAGPGGEMGEFEITHTFGWEPLQQYLVPFPGGRLQTLPIAWDTEEGKWFRVPPDEPVDPDDWLYWTNAAQNWNGMCAQCHSTNLDKNYDPESDSYNTTWSDIDVGCEACHGPGSEHVEWAGMPDMARPAIEGYRLARNTSNLDSVGLVEQCAACHSRRGALGDIDHVETEFMNTFRPSALEEGLYFPDGQILDEVYVYGSFIQSKMYLRNVSCSDCHDVHTAERLLEGNALCLQCHRESEYDTFEHHFHKQEGEQGEPITGSGGEILWAVGTGAQCEQCHMPGRYYMGNDYRPDHSFRVPDPALAAATGSPDACLRCHVDEISDWSQEKVVEWYGPGERSHYGEVLHRGRTGDPQSEADLAALAGDALYPVNARTSAVQLLGNLYYPGAVAASAIDRALLDEEPMIRHAAVTAVQAPDQRSLAKILARSLHDPVRAVRIEAASRLAGDLRQYLNIPQAERLDTVLAEFEQAMNYSADFAFGRYNLGNLRNNQGRPDEAIAEYEAAIRIDKAFYPAVANLAVLYNAGGENERAVRILKDALDTQPDLYEAAYSLGLILVEMNRPGEALEYLARASDGMPRRSRIHYNLGLLYQQQGDLPRAEVKLVQALGVEPGNLDFQYALADHYVKRGLYEQAMQVAQLMIRTHPENPVGSQVMQYIQGLVRQEETR